MLGFMHDWICQARLSRSIVGGVDIRNRVFLAPMSGVTDRAVPPARPSRMAPASSCPRWSPAANSPRAALGTADVHAIPACPSTWSSSPAARRAHMAEAARIAAGEGADIIDINMGCPAKKVTGGYSGSALMRDLDHALTLIDAVVGAVDVPVTREDAARLGRGGAQRAGAGPPRRAGRREDGHHPRPHALPVLQGQGRLAAPSRASSEAISIPVVANGDVATPADAASQYSRTVGRRRRDDRPRPAMARRGRPAQSRRPPAA